MGEKGNGGRGYASPHIQPCNELLIAPPQAPVGCSSCRCFGNFSREEVYGNSFRIGYSAYILQEHARLFVLSSGLARGTRLRAAAAYVHQLARPAAAIEHRGRPMTWFPSVAFLAWKKPKLHRLVEDAERLDAVFLVFQLSDHERRTQREWRPPLWPGVVLVRGRRGALNPYWHFVCPSCGRRREALYRPAGEREWKCRKCHSLIYASHRHGPRHPSRQRLPYRTRRKRQREAKRQLRAADRHRRALAKEARRMRRDRTPPLAPSTPDRDRDAVLTSERVDFAITMIPGHPETARRVPQAQVEAEVRVQAALDADAERNARFLAGSPSTPKRLRTKAAKFLAERAPEPPAPSPEAVAPMLSPELRARLEKAMRLDRGDEAQPTPATKPTTLAELREMAGALRRSLDALSGSG